MRRFLGQYLDDNLSRRVIFSLIVGCAFMMIPYYGTRLYYQYVDDRQYIKVVDPVTFDKKVYSAGETQTTKLKLQIDVDSETMLRSRLMLVLQDSEFKVIKQDEVKGFVAKQKGAQTFVIDAPIPCNLKEGSYFYRAELQYELLNVRVRKITPFESELFTINNNRASDSAQIKTNCDSTEL